MRDDKISSKFSRCVPSFGGDEAKASNCETVGVMRKPVRFSPTRFTDHLKLKYSFYIMVRIGICVKRIFEKSGRRQSGFLSKHP